MFTPDSDSDSYFKKTKIVNFEIIHRQAWSEKVPEELFKKLPNCSRKKDKTIS